MVSIRDFFVRFMSEDQSIEDWKNRAIEGIGTALRSAVPDLTEDAGSVWRTAFSKNPEAAAGVLVGGVLAEAASLWEYYPELARTPFLLASSHSSLSAELAGLSEAECLRLVGEHWPPEEAGHARAGVQPDALQYSAAGNNSTSVPMSWLDIYIVVRLAQMRPTPASVPKLGLDFQDSCPLWAAFYYAPLTTTICAHGLSTSEPDEATPLAKWWAGCVSRATDRGCDPIDLLGDEQPPERLFGLQKIKEKYERTQNLRNALRERLVPYELLGLQEAEEKLLLRATACAYARRFPLEKTSMALALLTVAKWVLAHRIAAARIRTLRSSPEEVAEKTTKKFRTNPDMILKKEGRGDALLNAVMTQTNWDVWGITKQELEKVLDVAEQLLFGYAIAELNSKNSVLDVFYRDPRTKNEMDTNRGRPDCQRAMLRTPVFASVLNSSLRAFSCLNDDKPGLDLIAFTRIYELLQIAIPTAEGLDPALMKHYWFGNLANPRESDDGSDRRRIIFAKKLGTVRSLITDAALPVPDDIRQAIRELAGWFLSTDN
jgi:hypothetical protein